MTLYGAKSFCPAWLSRRWQQTTLKDVPRPFKLSPKNLPTWRLFAKVTFWKSSATCLAVRSLTVYFKACISQVCVFPVSPGRKLSMHATLVKRICAIPIYVYVYVWVYIYIFLFFFFLTAVGHALDVVVTDRNRRGNTVNTSAHLDHYRVREFTPGGRNTTKECQIVSEPPNKQTTCWTIQANLHSLGLHAVWQRS